VLDIAILLCYYPLTIKKEDNMSKTINARVYIDMIYTVDENNNEYDDKGYLESEKDFLLTKDGLCSTLDLSSATIQVVVDDVTGKFVQ
jgi:hypothetical protein